MADLSQMSDADLQDAYAKSAPTAGSLAAMSDKDLQDAYYKSVQQQTLMAGPTWDEYSKETPLGRVLQAFGQGASESWGVGNLGLSPETEEGLKRAGIFPDVQKGQGGWVRAFNEAVIRPAGVLFDAVNRSGSALLGGVRGALNEAGQEAGIQYLGDVTQIPQAFAGSIPAAGVAGEAEAAVSAPARESFAPGSLGYSTQFRVDLPQAHSLHVIGSGESGWKGTVEAKPPPESLIRDAVHAQQDVEPAIGEEVPPPTPAKPADIHEAARQIAPDVFREYDGLSGQRDLLRQRLTDAQEHVRQNAESQAPHAAEIADLQRRMQDTTPRLAKKYEARLADLLPEHDAFLADESKMAPLLADTPEMAGYRRLLMETDFQMRDLAPDVTAAYQEAAEQFPEAAEAPQEPMPALAEVPTGTAAPEAVEAPQEPAEQTPAASAPEPAAEPAAPPAPAAAPVNIRQDVAAKLQAAGRPEEEAQAAAEIVAAHYEARAARFDGAKGASEELYGAEAPDVIGAEKGGRKGDAAGKAAIKDGRTIVTLFQKADASTFMHETGHAWLEELMRDASDEAAPDGLKADAAAVHKWLGTKEGETIPTKAHEKFARGFERYLMEGTAPSRPLDRVFGQFKDWLTKIYHTVAKLRAPITDDIRDVFDRLITVNPERRAVVAPESAIAEAGEVRPTRNLDVAAKVTKDLAELHETDAAHVEPAQAAEAADQIRSEIDEMAQRHAPESDNGSAGPDRGAGSENGGGAGENPAIPGVGGTPEPVAADSGILRESGTLDTRGSGVAPQSNPVSEGQPAAAVPTNPNQPFAGRDSGLVDKAGNIRLDLLNQPETVNQVIREAAEANGGFMDARRGVLSDAEVISLADALGMDAQSLSARKIGQAFNAEEIKAAAKLLVQSGSATHAAMVKAATGTDAEVMAYAEAKARHQMIQEQFSGVVAEAGRALRIMQTLHSLGNEADAQAMATDQFVKNATGRTLFQLRQEAQEGAKLKTPQQVSKFINDSKKASFPDMLLEYWINGLISGPATHTTYTVGNALLALWKAVPETAVAAAIGKARNVLTGTEDRAYMGEVGAQLYGILKGSREGVFAAGQALKTGQTTLLPGENRAAFALQDTPRGAIPGVLGEVVRLPSRGVATIHSFFRAVGYSQEKAALAYRSASQEGLSGNDFATRVAELSTNPSEAMMAKARDAATVQTLMGQGGEFTQAIARLSDARLFGFPLVKFVMPFVKIGANIMGQGLLERTPFGLLDADIRANLMGRNGAVARDTQIARISVGTAVAATAIGLASEGYVTGGGPSNPREAAVWRMTGKQPYSVRIGDTWYGIHRLGPLAVVLGVGADAYEMGHAISADSADKIGGLMVTTITKGLLDETWMRGPAELIQAIEDPDRYGARYIRDQLSSFVPFSVGMSQIARATDPYSRQARSLIDEVKDKTPWLSQTLLPRRDIWGEPTPNKDALGVPGLSAIYETHVNNDPINAALLRLHVFPAQPERKIRGVELTDQQYDDYSRIAGRMTKTRLDALVHTPGFSALPTSQQATVISETISHSREQARAIIMLQSPSIIHQAVNAKMKIAHGISAH